MGRKNGTETMQTKSAIYIALAIGLNITKYFMNNLDVCPFIVTKNILIDYCKIRSVKFDFLHD